MKQMTSNKILWTVDFFSSFLIMCMRLLYRIALYALVSAALVEAGMTGGDWCDACIAAAGAGKGGGKPNLAMASIPYGDLAVVGNVITAANEFAAKW